MIYTSANAEQLIVPWRQDLANLIPHARELDWKGERWLVMPNKHAEAKVARNLGVPVPAPILTTYDWMGATPWEIQKTTAGLLSESERCYVLSTMGTGKTKAALWAADYLLKTGRASKVLVSAPLSTLTPVWGREIFHTLPGRKFEIVHGTKSQRLAKLTSDASVFVINHHGLHVLREALIAAHFDIMIIDELAVFRNRGTDLWKAANAIANGPDGPSYVWGLTGSPTPRAPVDAWAQVRLLTPARVTKSVTQFRDATMRRITDFKWVPRENANDLVYHAMQPSVRFVREDVMELPPTTYADRIVKMDKDTARAYKVLHDKLRHTFASGETATAANEGVLHNKLLQVACGFIYTDSGTVYALGNTERLSVLEEVIDETDRKVIVFVPYIHALQGVAEHLRKLGHTVDVVYGATSMNSRNETFRKFQDETDPRIIVAHPQCMAHGLTLTAANTIIWFAPTQSLEIYEQANARITRPGQTAKTLIVNIQGTQVERLTYKRLMERSTMQGALLDLFQHQSVEY